MDSPFRFSFSANWPGILIVLGCFACGLIGMFCIGYLADRPMTGLEMARVEGGQAFVLGLPILVSVLIMGIIALPLGLLLAVSLGPVNE